MTDSKMKLQLPSISLAQLDVDVPGIMILFLNSQGIVIEINQSGCEILGHTREEIIGQSWFSRFLPESVRIERRSNFDNMINGKTHLEYYAGPVSTTEGEKFIAWHGMIIHNKSGKAIGVLFSGRDITDQRHADVELKKYLQRLEETIAERTSEFTKQNIELKVANIEQQRTKSGLNLKSIMLEKAPESIVLTDFAGNITYLNEVGRRTFESEEPKTPGTNLSESAISGVKKVVSSVSGELKEKRHLKYEASFTRRDGTTIQMEVHSCVIETAYGDRVLSIVHDLTK